MPSGVHCIQRPSRVIREWLMYISTLWKTPLLSSLPVVCSCAALRIGFGIAAKAVAIRKSWLSVIDLPTLRDPFVRFACMRKEAIRSKIGLSSFSARTNFYYSNDWCLWQCENDPPRQPGIWHVNIRQSCFLDAKYKKQVKGRWSRLERLKGTSKNALFTVKRHRGPRGAPKRRTAWLKKKSLFLEVPLMASCPSQPNVMR